MGKLKKWHNLGYRIYLKLCLTILFVLILNVF